MQRVLRRALLTVRRSPHHLVLSNSSRPSLQQYASGLKRLNSTSSAARAAPHSSRSMRKITVGVLSAVVLAGAVYYTYNNTAMVKGVSDNTQGEETVEGVRKVVAIDDNELYTGTIPLSKKIEDTGGKKILGMLTPEEATSKLRKNEESYLVKRGKGVWRYDTVQLASNNPIEDDHAEKIVEVPNPNDANGERTDWMFWGVFDGHSGWTTSAKLRDVLIGFVARELNSTYKATASEGQKYPSAEAIDQAIKNGFLRLDREIVHESVEKVFQNPSKVLAAEYLAPALSGSCALLAFYESQSKLLRVACTGDSRAVLGRRGQNGKWVATALSVDQTGSNKEEAERMRSEHPGEQVIRNGRVLGGLEPSRAFGDAFYKWSLDTQLKIKQSFWGRTPSQALKTPPYVTAEPVVTTTKIQPENGDFLVMATDGLWEMLTNEEVVGLVGKWLEDNKIQQASGSKMFSFFSKGGSSSDGGLPVEAGGPQSTPIRKLQWGVKENDVNYTVEDKNAATHLVRNALGGKNSEMLCALLTLPSPYSRRYRDDLTVEVIFFGDHGEKTGEVKVNPEATAPSPTPEPAPAAEPVKAKL